MSMRWMAMIVAALLPAAACFPNPDDLRASSSSGGLGGATGGTGTSADLAAAFCGQVQRCTPTQLTFAFGTQTQCQSRLKLSYDALLALVDTGWTSATPAACASAWRSQACNDFADGASPAACLPAGKRANGRACRGSDQCNSLRCVFTSTSDCGVCQPRGAAGASCGSDVDCQLSLGCVTTSLGVGLCTTPGSANQTCDPDIAPCRGSLACIQGRCATPGGRGAPCANFGECDIAHGFFCNPVSSTCTAGVDSATTCSYLTDGTLQYCRASALCLDTMQCLAAAADNQACSDSDGPLCTFPADCVNGVCRLPTTTDCQ